jgi:Lrp/AsnC family leucine-responsive transcriptional regulator
MNSNESTIDRNDLLILETLTKNAKYSYAEIGRLTSISPSTIRERILQLEENGVIKEYRTIIDYKVLGYGLEAFILIKIFSGKLKTFLGMVRDFKEVRECYRITGSENVHLKVILKDQEHLQELLDKLMNYRDTATHLILSEVTEGREPGIR